MADWFVYLAFCYGNISQHFNFVIVAIDDFCLFLEIFLLIWFQCRICVYPLFPTLINMSLSETKAHVFMIYFDIRAKYSKRMIVHFLMQSIWILFLHCYVYSLISNVKPD